MTDTHTYIDIIVTDPAPHVRQITMNRPKQLNALSANHLHEIVAALNAAADDDEVRAVVLTGGEKVFAAGADLNEMAKRDLVGELKSERHRVWDSIRRFPKPLIAAVNGFALGGGCELAMHADIIIAGATAKFGQPEVNVGIMPGAGGTQRLARTVGKSLAMRMVLSGEMIDAVTALRSGLVAEVTPYELTIERAVRLARTIAEKPPISVRLAKEAVLKSFDLTLEAGLDFERRAFNIILATEDRKEGVAAFLEKRRPAFKGR
ncbi:MAG: 2,3-dehydroadipyl-CoA hydratase [Alphaproteobacteria bacterium]|nr:2,3-dehydroadipyl-CoA hydratase [Alphaproteobacteria bacterium]